jgi:hypothetical protein
MRPQIRLWSVSNGNLIKLSESSFSQAHKEKDLEDWLYQDPSLLGRDLTVIGRQVFIPKVGPLDLLAVDESGRLVVIEFKRQQTTRDTIAQILDYASSIQRMNLEQLHSLPNMNAEALSEVTNFDPALILVAADADEAVERIVEYLASKAHLPIEVVTFTYAMFDDKREIIARSILIPETSAVASSPTNQISQSELFTIAEERKVLNSVETLHQVTKLGWSGEMFRSNGGKIRYWVTTPDGGWRVLFGMNIGGEKQASPEGALDVWLRPEIIAAYSELPPESIMEQLSQFNIINQTTTRVEVRIVDQRDATKLYDLLKKWDSFGVESRAKSPV